LNSYDLVKVLSLKIIDKIMKTNTNILGIIKERRSVREFTDRDLDNETLKEILEAGRWAPSGLNNQPWRFVIVKNDKIKNNLAEQTSYGYIINSAPVNIIVFMDKSASYDKIKDILSIGACIQNMLLTAHSLGVGSVWLGEILKNKDKVNEILNVPTDWELMAVIALGYPVKKKRKSNRKPLRELIYNYEI